MIADFILKTKKIAMNFSALLAHYVTDSVLECKHKMLVLDP